MQATCQYCHKPLYATQEFCLYCGNPMSPTSSDAFQPSSVVVKRGSPGQDSPWLAADPTVAPSGIPPLHPDYERTGHFPSAELASSLAFPDPALGLYSAPPSHPLMSPRPLSSGPMSSAQASAPWKMEMTKELPRQAVTPSDSDPVEDSTWIRDSQSPSAFDQPLLPPGVVTAEVPAASPFSPSPPSSSSVRPASHPSSSSHPSPSQRPNADPPLASRPDFAPDSPLLHSRRSSFLLPALASFAAVLGLGLGVFFFFGRSSPDQPDERPDERRSSPPTSETPASLALQTLFQQAKADILASRWEDARRKVNEILAAPSSDEQKEQARQIKRTLDTEEKGQALLLDAEKAIQSQLWGQAAHALRSIPPYASAQTKARSLFQKLLSDAIPAERKKAARFLRQRKYFSALQAQLSILQIDPGDPAARRAFSANAKRLTKLHHRCSAPCKRRFRSSRKEKQRQTCLASCSRRFPLPPQPPPPPPPSPSLAQAASKRKSCLSDCKANAQTQLDDCRSLCKGRRKARCRKKCLASFRRSSRLCPRSCR